MTARGIPALQAGEEVKRKLSEVAAEAAAELDRRAAEREDGGDTGEAWRAEAEADAWGGRGPSASYAEWRDEGQDEAGG
jgi:hypothetical protein